jgi:hypothetical protein
MVCFIQLLPFLFRNFAKRQMTWFRNEHIYHWLDASKPLVWSSLMPCFLFAMATKSWLAYSCWVFGTVQVSFTWLRYACLYHECAFFFLWACMLLSSWWETWLCSESSSVCAHSKHTHACIFLCDNWRSLQTGHMHVSIILVHLSLERCENTMNSLI